jgi:hypothetical protein
MSSRAVTTCSRVVLVVLLGRMMGSFDAVAGLLAQEEVRVRH